MPTSPKRKRDVAKELMTVERRREDAALHESILADGDHAKAEAVSVAVMRDLGFSDAQISAFYGKTKAYDESEHPRDEHGRWTDAGGSDAGSAKPEPSKPKPGSKDETSEQQLDRIIDSVPGAREKIDAARAKLNKDVPTHKLLSEGGLRRRDGTYTPERQKAHAKIIEDTFTPERIAAATPKPGEQPVVHLLGGAGGSGKGWYTGPKGTINKDTAIYLNSDDVKAALPGYQGWNAAHVHEESSELADLMEKGAQAGRLNVIIDGTMGKLSKLEERIAAYRRAGYRIEGHFMRVTPETSATRALGRFVRGGETGRFVPPELLLKHAATQNFEKASAKMDAWEMYDNEGTEPKFVKRG